MRKTAIRAEFEAGEPRIFASRAQLSKRAAQYHPLDGQLVPRSSDAGLLAAIIAGEVPSCTDADWLADKSKRGMYTLGDGSTNVRLPDWNGKSSGAIGAPVIRGDGANADEAGIIQGDCIRNFTARIGEIGVAEGKNFPANIQAISGACKGLTTSGRNLGSPMSGQTVTGGTSQIEIDPSMVVPTGPENRMVNTSCVHAVKR